ncbi:MAG: hypothetical protein LUQ31_05690, partial [Methanoregula sp.]|nr:hypothetical protein [Methanoregula sp.]
MKRTTTPKKPAPHRTTTQTILDVTGPAFPRGDLTGTAGESFREVVLAFYKNHGRHDMPWRHTDDPYRILVSEIMLQQTQVERVTVKYPEFIAAFPDFAALAQAPLHDVL